IRRIDDKEIKSYQDLLSVLRGAKVGDKLMMEVVRGTEVKKLELTLGERGGFGPGGPSRTRPYRAYYGGQRENAQKDQGPDGQEYGGVYKSTDGGESWVRVNSLNPRPMYFSQVRVDPSDERHVYVCGINMHHSSNGGESFQVVSSRQGY